MLKKIPSAFSERILTLASKKNFTCLNPEHADRNPSMSYIGTDPHHPRVYCHGCNISYDMIDLIGLDMGTEGASMFEEAYRYFGLSVESESHNETKKQIGIQLTEPIGSKIQTDYSLVYTEAKANIHQTNYLLTRGIRDEIVRRFEIGYMPHWRPPTNPNAPQTPRIIIPKGKGSYFARDIRPNREITEKQRPYTKMQVGIKIPFNLVALQQPLPVFITEGEIDALTFYEIGCEAIGLGGSGNYRLIEAIQALKDNKTVTHIIPPIILALDNDEAGRAAADKLSVELETLGVCYYRPEDLYGTSKDANEALLADRETFAQKAKAAETEVISYVYEEQNKLRTEYEKNSVVNYLDGFINGIQESINTPAISTGFETLDKALDGGLYEGFYVLGAISSLGKTTFVLQMADQMAAAGQDVLIFSLEQSRSELMSKSISRESFVIGVERSQKQWAKTARGITDGKRYAKYAQGEKALIREAINAYSVYAGHLYIHEGMGDIGVNQIREIVAQHIMVTGKLPVVIIDYLQILSPYDPRGTDKQNTDKSVIELKRISRDFKIPILAISSFNRENYNNPVSMIAFKESGAVEYSSDVLIGLQYAAVRREKEQEGQSKPKGNQVERFNLEIERERDPREIELVILKNRNGRTHRGIAYNYYALHNFYDERGGK